MKKRYIADIKEMAEDFINCDSIDDLVRLGFDKNQLLLLSLKPSYYTFSVPKRSGKMRTIEAPKEALKTIQRKLNGYLQCVYYVNQTAASYGYIISARREQNPKNILENAKQHLGAKHLLNVDFQDFFHQFTTNRVRGILKQHPFNFEKELAHLLTRLCTYRGRLPMGTPTSPALTNLGTIKFDKEMLEWAQNNKLTYTRFVDDLSFSSNDEITSSTLQMIKDICDKHRLHINPSKIKKFGPNDLKKVTGLLIRETVDVDDSFYIELDKDLYRLRHLAEVRLIMNRQENEESFIQFKQEVQGQINFIGMIEGYNSKIFSDYRKRLKSALNPDPTILSVRWTNLNYL